MRALILDVSAAVFSSWIWAWFCSIFSFALSMPLLRTNPTTSRRTGFIAARTARRRGEKTISDAFVVSFDMSILLPHYFLGGFNGSHSIYGTLSGGLLPIFTSSPASGLRHRRRGCLAAIFSQTTGEEM